MTNDTVLIDFKSDTPINLDELPEGLTAEEAQEIRTLVVRLRAQGLNVLFAVARTGEALAFQFASGDARVLREVAAQTAVQLDQFVEDRTW